MHQAFGLTSTTWLVCDDDGVGIDDGDDDEDEEDQNDENIED